MYGLYCNGQQFEDTKGLIRIRTSKDRLQWPKVWRYQKGNHNHYPFGIFKDLAIVVCPLMYGLWLPLWYLQVFNLGVCPSMYGLWKFEDTKGLIIIRTSMRDRLQWPKVWRYQRGNQKPYIVEGQTTMAKGLKISKGSLSLIDVRIMITPLVSSNFWPL
jgi:hypothetical protein